MSAQGTPAASSQRPTVFFGHIVCACGRLERTEVGWKTGGKCAECFRAEANAVEREIIVNFGREPIRMKVHTSRKRPAQRRARTKRPKSRNERRTERLAAQCQSKALRRLRDLYPGMFEVLLADERANAGLNAWSIDRALTSHEAHVSLQNLRSYYHLVEAS